MSPSLVVGFRAGRVWSDHLMRVLLAKEGVARLPTCETFRAMVAESPDCIRDGPARFCGSVSLHDQGNGLMMRVDRALIVAALS